MRFADPHNIIWLVVFVVPTVWLYLSRRGRGTIKFSSLDIVRALPQAKLRRRHIPIILRVLVLLLLVIGLMRPRKGLEETKLRSEGVDIILAVDVSGSMRAEDFTLNRQRRNRLEVVKEVIKDFIDKRSSDRIGLVVFAGQAYMQCPITLDYDILLEFLDKMQIGMIEDGTAVGDGLTVALSRFKDVKSKSKVVILLTDGMNNAGRVAPGKAADLAKALGVRVYTIGAGSKGRVPYPAQDIFGNKTYQWVTIDIDEDALRRIAQTTGGKYYRAVDTKSLGDIYSRIDRLEKTEKETVVYGDYKECFPGFIVLAFVLIVVDAVLGHSILRRLP